METHGFEPTLLAASVVNGDVILFAIIESYLFLSMFSKMWRCSEKFTNMSSTWLMENLAIQRKDMCKRQTLNNGFWTPL